MEMEIARKLRDIDAMPMCACLCVQLSRILNSSLLDFLNKGLYILLWNFSEYCVVKTNRRRLGIGKQHLLQSLGLTLEIKTIEKGSLMAKSNFVVQCLSAGRIIGCKNRLSTLYL